MSPIATSSARRHLPLYFRKLVNIVLCGVPLRRFLDGNGYEATRRRNARFKLIPHIIKASWVVKGAVGSTPVLLGNKLLTKYFKCGSCPFSALPDCLTEFFIE
jgi:hypothetical protein